MSQLPGETPLSTWRALFDAADELKALAPWEWMSDTDLFALRDPESGQINYCSVLGQDGQKLALTVYLGSEGLSGYLTIAAGAFDERPADALFSLHCLVVSFEDRNQLDRGSYAQIKLLGRTYRGRQAWPQFYDYTPGYLPWKLTLPQVRLLTVAIRQTCAVARRFKTDRAYLEGPNDTSLLLREFVNGSWQDRRHAPDLAPKPPPVDGLRLKQLAARRLKRLGSWEADHFYIPRLVDDEQGGRPYYPLMLLIVDSTSRRMQPPIIAEPNAWHQAFQQQLLDLFEQMGCVPREIRLRDEALAALLSPIAAALKIKLYQTNTLHDVDAARAALLMTLDAAGPVS